jgi:hypothetical protein
MEHGECANRIIHTLVKFYVIAELSETACPLCREESKHDHECPIRLAWSCLSEEQQEQVRRSIHALALSIGEVTKQSNTMMQSEENASYKCSCMAPESLNDAQ